MTRQPSHIPTIAITMGDPGGVGPEIICKALTHPEIHQACRPVIIGSPVIMQAAARQFASQITFVSIDSLAQLTTVPSTPHTVTLYSPSDMPPDDQMEFATTAAANGHASHACIVAATHAALARQVDAICTAPIAKEALFKAGYTVPGHTELLAEICGSSTVRMMLVGGGLHVILQTIHVALSQVPALLTPAEIVTSLRIIKDFATLNGINSPRIAVCGLNPHAGEGGHFGNEEQAIITPALEQASALGVNATGPLPADTVFHRTLQKDFDFVLAMYHDQGLTPVKTLDFHGGVNATLGLPIIRTSPDHGTAFNIAGKGIAHEGSIMAAIHFAARVAHRRRAAL